ncbi:MAG TPA: DNA topoisomerase IV, partial [Bifidobacterium sp.]|nr:DNA topoisomerase IV [Bifidobacterium sp.]
LDRILASDKVLDDVVIDEMDEAVAKYGSPRRTVLLDKDADGALTPVVAHGDDEASSSALAAARAAATVSSAAADVAAAKKAAKKAGEDNVAATALQIDDEPCVVMLSATGLIARAPENALERWRNRSASDRRVRDDQIISIFRTTTRSSYGLVTSAGRLVLAHVVELPAVPADGPLSVEGGVRAEEFIGMTESTDPVASERVVAAIAMPNANEDG